MTEKKHTAGNGKSNASGEITTKARELCLLLEGDSSDAAVVARAGLAALAGTMTVLDTRIILGASPKMASRLAHARRVLENTKDTVNRRRLREIEAVEGARRWVNAEGRVPFLLFLLKDIDPGWKALSENLTPPRLVKLARDLEKRSPSAARIAADLATWAGLEHGSVLALYRQSAKRMAAR